MGEAWAAKAMTTRITLRLSSIRKSPLLAKSARSGAPSSHSLVAGLAGLHDSGQATVHDEKLRIFGGVQVLLHWNLEEQELVAARIINS